MVIRRFPGWICLRRLVCDQARENRVSGGNIAYGCGAGVHSRCVVFALGDARKVAQALDLVISSS